MRKVEKGGNEPEFRVHLYAFFASCLAYSLTYSPPHWSSRPAFAVLRAAAFRVRQLNRDEGRTRNGRHVKIALKKIKKN